MKKVGEDIGQQEPSTFDDLMRLVLKHLPMAQLEEDYDGQIVIYTNLRETSDGRVVPIDPNNE